MDEQASQAHYRELFGRPHHGLDFWLAERPDVLARYRAFGETTAHVFMPGQPESGWRMRSFSLYTFYALSGYAAGVRYLVHLHQQVGLTRDEILEGIGIAFIHGGPRGMETVAEALDGYEWVALPRRARFPASWTVDPAAFRSGIDYTSPALTPDELRKIEAWYERWLGAVPPYVRLLASLRPELLKAHRIRYENLMRVLPKQVLPMTLLANEVLRGFEPGIRENVLLARGFGVTKDDVLDEIHATLIFGGMEGIEAVDRAAGDIFETWS
jgi:hypothetical protein